MAEALQAFTITRTGESYLIHIEDENGHLWRAKRVRLGTRPAVPSDH